MQESKIGIADGLAIDFPEIDFPEIDFPEIDFPEIDFSAIDFYKITLLKIHDLFIDLPVVKLCVGVEDAHALEDAYSFLSENDMIVEFIEGYERG